MRSRIDASGQSRHDREAIGNEQPRKLCRTLLTFLTWPPCADDGGTARVHQFPGSLKVQQLDGMFRFAKFLRIFAGAVDSNTEVSDPGISDRAKG